jgi:xanthine dehydrogenase large subunit
MTQSVQASPPRPRTGESPSAQHDAGPTAAPQRAATVADTGSVGQPAPHDSAHLHVAGRATYVDDIPEVRGTLHLAPVLSPHAHAMLHGIDAAAARALPEVIDVLDWRDVPGDNALGPVLHDEPVLPQHVLEYRGQPVALVLARTVKAARVAARAVRIDATPLPAILDVDTAIAQASQVLPPLTVVRGAPDAKLAAAPHRVEGELRIGGQEHFYLEGQVAYAVPREDGQLLVYSSTQHPGEVQIWVAHALGIPFNRVTVECRRMGGGFGGKESQAGHVAVWAALAAVKHGCPVKLRLDRDDDFCITGKRHDFLVRYRAGCDARGRLQGLKLWFASRCGFSADFSGPVNDRAVFHADNCYALGDVAIESLRLKTHMPSATAFRGFGGPQGMMAIEAVLEHIARALGLDPLDVRRANLYAASPDDPARSVTHYGQTVEHNVAPALIEELARDSRYVERRAAIIAFNATSPVIKRGLALTPVKFGISFTYTPYNQAAALVQVYRDGTVRVHHGGTEMGQGLHVKVLQVVADELGVPLAQVRIAAADTGIVPNASATAASSGADMNGMAAQAAARAVRERLAAHVAQQSGCAADAVSFSRGEVRWPGGARPFAQVAEQAYLARVQLWSDGFYTVPKIHFDRASFSGRPFYYFAWGAAVSEVAIDTLTGEMKILRADILHDVGRSLNPAIDIGQIEGGFVQGAGWLTTEELVWDQAGRLATHAPSTYKIPVASDAPRVFNVRLWDGVNAEDTVYRSKAVGEPPLMLAISVFHALRHAVEQAGGDAGSLHAPATPEAILRAVSTAPAARGSRP